MIRHSDLLNANEALKGQINHLRKDRTTANDVHAQFEAGIQQVRAEISKLMAQASLAHERREELVKAKDVRIISYESNVKDIRHGGLSLMPRERDG